MGNKTSDNSNAKTDELKVYQQLLSMGFDDKLSFEASQKFQGNINQAIEYVTNAQNNGVDIQPILHSTSEAKLKSKRNIFLTKMIMNVHNIHYYVIYKEKINIGKPKKYKHATNEQEQHKCGQCNKIGATKRCSRCKKLYYCDQECQRANWKLHKLNCAKAITASASATVNNNPYTFICQKETNKHETDKKQNTQSDIDKHIFTNKHTNNHCNSIQKCLCIRRIKQLLILYNNTNRLSFLSSNSFMNIIYNKLDTNYRIIDILNDYIHMVKVHTNNDDEFSRLYHFINIKCHFNSCNGLKRNQRDRTKKDNDDNVCVDDRTTI
eukprot:288716_1